MITFDVPARRMSLWPDDPDEFAALSACREPLLLGVRERKDAGDLAEGVTYGYDRFGMTSWICITCRGGLRGDEEGPAPDCPCGGLVRPRVTL